MGTPMLSLLPTGLPSGATGVARRVLDGLTEVVDDHRLLQALADALLDTHPGYGSMWHIARAAYADDPGPALREIRERLDIDVDRSVTVAIKMLLERGGAVRTAPSSSLVKAVVAALPAGSVDQTTAAPGPRAGATVPDVACTGLVGADAISPTTVLNIRGTLELARSMPTIVVTTSLKLVPENVFERLGSPTFERIPLHLFHAVVLDGEVVNPAEAGRRASALG